MTYAHDLHDHVEHIQDHGMHAWGVSTIKYTISLPCIGLNESDSKLFITFEFCKGKNHKYLKNTLIYKAKQFMLTIFFSRKVYIF